MTLDGFLTFLTLLIGALAFMPSASLLRLRLAVHGWLLWSLLGLTCVMYFEFFNVVGLRCLQTPSWLNSMCSILEFTPGAPDEQGVTPQQAAFLVVLIWMAGALLAVIRPRPRMGSMSTLGRLIERLADERRLADLFDLMEPNLNRVDAFATRRSWLQRMHDAVSPGPQIRSREMDALIAALGDSEAPPEPSFMLRAGLRVRGWVAAVLPSGLKEQEAAEDILRVLTTRRDILEHAVAFRTSFGARLLGLRHHRVEEFADRFFELLVSTPESVLYDQVEASQNLGPRGYVLPPDAAVLRAIFDDATVADKLGVYRPVAETVISKLNPINDPQYLAGLNQPWDLAFQERGRWRDPVYLSIRFFDIMVQAAAYQGVQSHMWLYYMDHLSAPLVLHYDDTGTNVDRDAEWPTRSSHMLYSIVDVLRDWIKLPERLPAGSPHRTVEDLRIDRGTNNLSKAAAVTLGDVLKTVLLADNVDDRFKGYLLEVAIRWMRDWRPSSDLAWVRTIAIAAIAKGGTLDAGEAYRNVLCELYAEIDRPWHHDLRDFEAAIGYPRAPRLAIAPPLDTEASKQSLCCSRSVIGRAFSWLKQIWASLA